MVGRVLTMEPEPQKNGKTINWCTVDVADANGTGEPQGIVCGAHNFAPGDLVVVVLPGGVLPGGFEICARKTYGHVSAGMICSARELGLGDDHDGIIVLPADAGTPGEDVRPLLGLDEETIEFEINPDRAYALSIRGIAREVLRLGRGRERLPRPGRCATPRRQRPRATRSWSRTPTAARSSWPARSAASTRPRPRRTSWSSGSPPPACGRSRSPSTSPTTSCSRPVGPSTATTPTSCAARSSYDGRATGERLTTLDGTDRTLTRATSSSPTTPGIIGLGGVMGGETTEMSDTTTSILVEAAHWDAVSMFRTGRRHKITSEAGKRNERGVDPTICEAAADRVVELLVEHGGGRADPASPSSAPRRRCRSSRYPATSPRGCRACDHRGAQPSSACAPSAATSRGRDALPSPPPPWRPDLTDAQDFAEEVIRLVGYDRVPSVLPTPPSGRGLTRAQQLRRRIGRTLAGAGYVEVVNFPFVGDADLDALGLPADDPRRDLLRLSNPLSAEAPLMTTTPAARAAARRRQERRSRQRRRGDLRDRRPSPCPRHAGPAADPAGRPSPHRRGVRRPRRGAARRSRCTWRVVAAGDAGAGGWWGEAPSGRLVRRRRRRPRGRRRARASR